MKITIKVAKPRNRFVAAAKMRRAGPHETELSTRRARRTEKHQLHLIISGRKRGDADDV